MKAARAVALLATVLLSGCGYALVGKGMVVDPSIRKIGVPTFKDRTGKNGLDTQITHSVIDELLKRGRFEVVETATDVDALVEGELLSYRVVPSGYSAVEGSGGRTQASRYDVVVTARVRYSKTGQAEPIWESETFVFRDEYDLGSNPATYFDREDQAVQRLSNSFARSLVAAMLEAF